jgi:hypothetical protein
MLWGSAAGGSSARVAPLATSAGGSGSASPSASSSAAGNASGRAASITEGVAKEEAAEAIDEVKTMEEVDVNGLEGVGEDSQVVAAGSDGGGAHSLDAASADRSSEAG